MKRRINRKESSTRKILEEAAAIENHETATKNANCPHVTVVPKKKSWWEKRYVVPPIFSRTWNRQGCRCLPYCIDRVLKVAAVVLLTALIILSTNTYTASTIQPLLSSVSWWHMTFQDDQLKNSWPWPIIHIMNTRFMQYQGNLTTLATARLHLFRTVCLPSVIHQKNQNFLWIIKVDPSLDLNVKNELLKILQNELETLDNSSITIAERIFVIGSNSNFLTGHQDGAWRGGRESMEVLSHFTTSDLRNSRNIFPTVLRKRTQSVTNAEVWDWGPGNVKWLQSARESEAHRIVLETRLDADDGLHVDFIDHVQKDALKKFVSSPVSKDMRTDMKDFYNFGSYKWYYWCAESHFKWYLGADGPRGQLDVEKRSNFCITPGLTIGFNVGTDISDVPQYGHHELYEKLKDNHSCQSNYNNNNNRKNIITDEEHVKDPPFCLGFVHGFVAAVRSRTETSAGMADVQMRKSNKSQNDLWRILIQNFALYEEMFVETKTYFELNRKQIAKQNLEGQCRGDHSCKVSSRIQLQNIIDFS